MIVMNYEQNAEPDNVKVDGGIYYKEKAAPESQMKRNLKKDIV